MSPIIHQTHGDLNKMASKLANLPGSGRPRPGEPVEDYIARSERHRAAVDGVLAQHSGR